MTESCTECVESDEDNLSDKAYRVIHNVVDKAAYAANFALSFIMILMSAYHIYAIFTGDEPVKIGVFVGNIILLVCGLGIVLDRDRDLPKSVGMFAVGLGLYRVFIALSGLHPHSWFNLIYYLIMALGLNMTLSGRAYLMGRSRARTTMMMGSIAFLLLAIILIVYNYTISRDITEVLRNNSNTVLLGLMYFIFIMILDSEKLRRRDWLEVHNRTMNGIRRTYCIRNDAMISVTDAALLVKGLTTAEGWPVIDDSGPVTREIHLSVLNGDGRTHIIAQKWSGCDKIFLTMTDHDGGSVIQASRMDVCDIEYDATCISLISSDGTMVRFDITEDL